MASTKVNGVAYGTGLDTMVSLRPAIHTIAESGHVFADALTARNPDTKVFTLGNLTNTEAMTLGAWLARGYPVEIVSDSYGTVAGILDRFDAFVLGSTGGYGRITFQTGTSDLTQTWTVATLANDFSLTGASMPWLFGSVPSIQSGPAYTAATSWTITGAAEDGTTGALTIGRTDSADGTFVIAAV